MINIILVEEKTFFDCFQSDQTLSSYINSNLYHVKEWFVMTPTEGTYTLIVQMCVKSRVGYLPERPAQCNRDLVSRKLNSDLSLL